MANSCLTSTSNSLREVAPGVTLDDVRRATAAPLHMAANVCEMAFD